MVRFVRHSCCVLLLLLSVACEDEGRSPPTEGEGEATEQEREPEADTDGIDSMGDPVENESACPNTEPEAGDECDEASLVCKYGADPECRSRWICSDDGTWSLDVAMRDCGNDCPTDEPDDGDPCPTDRVQCTYGESATCRSLWLCWQDEWTEIVPGRDCEAEVTCPEATPETGSACSPEEATPEGQLCVYSGGTQCRCECGWGPPDADWDEAEASWKCNVIGAEFDPEYLAACPLEPPEQGADCDSESTCGYLGPAECEQRGAGVSVVQCIGGQWEYPDQ